ncbi:hypothetical protein K474DRAFT_1686137 [Panus rudis PR-1116 ss-1]|nr:hypothetical protein K474DRAFT_1686137 [Panus rudis PR-1116 ss-1]
MEEKRAKTLDALSNFIQSQRALLADTLSDIDRLKKLRNEIAAQPPDLDNNVLEFVGKIKATTTSLSQNAVGITAKLPDDFDWSVFSSADPEPFKSLASSARQAYEQHNQPKQTTTSAPTSLQQFLRESKRSIIDPVMATMPVLSSDEEEPPDPEELRRQEEREKIRDLKKRKIDEGTSNAGSFGGLGLRKPKASEGVHIRLDQEDESAEVDISGELETSSKAKAGRRKQGGKAWPLPSPLEPSSSEPPDSTMMEIDVDTPPTSVSSPFSGKSWPLPDPSTTASEGRSARTRRTTQRTAPPTPSSSKAGSSRAKGKQAVRKPATDGPSAAAEDEQEDEDAMDVDADAANGSTEKQVLVDKKGKPRPETYKQAWSVDEQHLLERLLEEIPDGEKNRWAKISKAMNGKRTARQVASRVQKYYAKLKRYGLDVD